ncbi:hypothetical protein QFZ32_000589 [Streptomyces canus]|nr:hypothetical protein [Streptomyces canus]
MTPSWTRWTLGGFGTTQPEPRTAAAVTARRQAAAVMLDRVRDVLGQLRRERSRVTFAAVARGADVSRTFLYQKGEARRLVEDAAESAAGQTIKDRPEKATPGSLATLLWRRILHQHDTQADLGHFTRLGLVTVPATLLASTVALWGMLHTIGT